MPGHASQKLHRDMEKSKHIRTTEKQTHLNTTYEVQITSFENQITDIITEYSQSVQQRRDEQKTRLAELVRRKAAVEVSLCEAVRELESFCDALQSDLEFVIGRRVGWVDGQVKVLEGLVVTGEGKEDNE